MKNILFVSALLLGICSCKKQDTYCGVKDPLMDINSIKERVERDPSGLWIFKRTYNGKEGFYYKVCVNMDCKIYSQYYTSCEGELLYQSENRSNGSFPADFKSGSTYLERLYPE